MRFFTRAIEIYEAGLRKFPNNFDLAYNKSVTSLLWFAGKLCGYELPPNVSRARVQYEIATHPVLVRQAQLLVLQMLETALVSHRYALQLEPDNADTLFNTAGVLTSIAEEIAKDTTLSDARVLNLLEEALELQNKCLSVQEYMFVESQEQQAAMMDASQLAETAPSNETATQPLPLDMDAEQAEEQWASVIEPVTKETLLDTIEAQLSTLTTLCSILSSSPGSAPASTLAWVEEYSSKLLTVKAPAYLEGTTDRSQGLALVKANFISALLEAGFRGGNLDAQTYKRERDAAFATADLNLLNNFVALVANAASLIAFNSALAETMLVDVAPFSSMRWNSLAAAIGDLTKAAKLTDSLAEDLAKTHLLRGDTSILQYQLSKPSVAYQPAVSNAASLLKNAEVYYRNASKLTMDDDEKKKEALLKEALVIFLQDKEKGLVKIRVLEDVQGSEWMNMQLDDVMTEGLFSQEDVEGLSSQYS
jgi:tetratricopeptide (TPR) repeat protein